jgi:hypothetical protein
MTIKDEITYDFIADLMTSLPDVHASGVDEYYLEYSAV